MTKFKTNEEYILNELYKTQEELYLANKKIEELQEKLNKDDTKEENDTNSPVMSGLNKQKPGKKEEWVSEGQLTLFDM